jgi:hypothetical protein
MHTHVKLNAGVPDEPRHENSSHCSISNQIEKNIRDDKSRQHEALTRNLSKKSTQRKLKR